MIEVIFEFAELKEYLTLIFVNKKFNNLITKKIKRMAEIML